VDPDSQAMTCVGRIGAWALRYIRTLAAQQEASPVDNLIDDREWLKLMLVEISRCVGCYCTISIIPEGTMKPPNI
jgi:hypothetical protein